MAQDKAANPAPTPRRRRSLLYHLVRVLLILLTLAGAGVLTAFLLVRTPPGWWRGLDPADPHVADAAQRVENGAATELTKVRPAAVPAIGPTTGSDERASEPWTIRISSADASAWLAARLRPWLESQDSKFVWPRDVERIEVEFESGRIEIAASLSANASGNSGRTQVLGAIVRPEIRAGALWLSATSVSIGRLGLPASWLLRSPANPGEPSSRTFLPDSLFRAGRASDFLEALGGSRPVMKEPTLRLSDGRRVRIEKLDPHDGALDITCRTLPREQSEPTGASRQNDDPKRP